MNLSFSGLKTSVRRIIEKNFSQSEKADLANEFQKSITECLLKVNLAMDSTKHYEIQDFVLSEVLPLIPLSGINLKHYV